MNGKRTFYEIRDIILQTLSTGQKTINQISHDTKIGWKTVENHLVYLVGKRLVKEVFSSDYVRIFELSDDGKEYLLKKYPKIIVRDKKIISINGEKI